MIKDNLNPETTLASEKQKKMFFALCKQLNLDSETSKERAKTKFGVEHFGEISMPQMKELIDALLQKINSGNKKLLTDCISYFDMKEAKKINPEIKSWEDYSSYLADYILSWFTIKPN